MKKLTLYTILITTIALTSCASAPKHIVISPDVIVNVTKDYQGQSINLRLIDRRAATHIVQILKEKQAATLISSQQIITEIIDEALRPQLIKQGLTLTSQAENNFDVIIDTALISVQQDLLKYQASSVIVLIAKISNAEQTLTKTFTIKGSSNGPLSADNAVLARDFNQQLAKIISQLVNNNEIKEFIR
ncbi:MAG: putative lipoprotein [Alteromonadaceae bacterium]|jgi:uncharacterized lipoprotein